jgi:hypothetical protein
MRVYKCYAPSQECPLIKLLRKPSSLKIFSRKRKRLQVRKSERRVRRRMPFLM